MKMALTHHSNIKEMHIIDDVGKCQMKQSRPFYELVSNKMLTENPYNESDRSYLVRAFHQQDF